MVGGYGKSISEANMAQFVILIMKYPPQMYLAGLGILLIA